MSPDDERPRRSWSEIDKRRESPRAREDERPRGRHAEARARKAAARYVKELDAMFAGDAGGARGAELATAIREAHGSADLPAACRAHLDALGWPRDTALLALFLDSGDRTLVIGALEALLTQVRDGGAQVAAPLRTQLGVLAEDFDSGIADVAEALLEAL